MKIGASTACFYPLETEKALKKVTDLGFEKAEVFVNAPCEYEEKFVNELCAITKDSPVFSVIIKDALRIISVFIRKPVMQRQCSVQSLLSFTELLQCLKFRYRMTDILSVSEN